MNTLKIQIKPFYKNNPFHLKDDQIHILSTNKNEEEIKQLLLQMNYENYSIFIQLELENYNYGYLFIDHKEYELYYYNDFDDYEDDEYSNAYYVCSNGNITSCWSWSLLVSNSSIPDSSAVHH